MLKYCLILFTFICQVSFSQGINKIEFPSFLNSDKITDVKISDNGTVYLLMYDTSLNKSKLFKTVDKLFSYSEINIQFLKENSFDRIFIKEDIIGLIHEYGAGDVYLWSFDNGATWKDMDWLSENMFPAKFNNEYYEIIYENKDYNVLTLYKYYNRTKNKISVYTFDVGKMFHNDYNKSFEFRDDNIYFLNNDFGIYYGRLNVESAKGRFESTHKSSVFFFRTSNGGKNWEKITSLQKYQDVYKPQFLDKNNGYIFCKTLGDSDNANGYLLKTTNGGLNWSTISECEDYRDLKFYFINLDVGLILFNEDLIFRTLNGGINMEPIDFLLNEGYIKSVEVFTDGTCLILSDDLYSFNIYDNYIVNRGILEKYDKRQEEILKKTELENINREANYYFESKLYNKALELYLKLENDYGYISSKNAFNIAYCFTKNRQNTDALKYYNECIKIDENSSSSYNNIGVIYQEMGDYKNALLYFQKAYDIEPDELYANNIESMKTLIYELSNSDKQLIYKYFPSHKRGSKLLYWQKNNTASYIEEVYLENNSSTYSNVLLNYYKNRSAYQVREIFLQETGIYRIKNNEFIYEGFNDMMGDYSITKIAFPKDNTSWSVLGIHLSFLGYVDQVNTIAGTFYNCLVLGKDYYKEYYAPDVGLVLVRAAIDQPSFSTDKELIDYSIVK